MRQKIFPIYLVKTLFEISDEFRRIAHARKGMVHWPIKPFVAFAFLLTAAVSGCKTPPDYSPIPSIELADFRFIDNRGGATDSLYFELKFKDGDGDLGLNLTETDPPYNESNRVLTDPFTGDTIGFEMTNPRYYNFFTDFYIKRPNGAFELVRDFMPGDPNLYIPYPFHGRFPILNEGLAKGPLDGTLYVKPSAANLQRRGSVGAFFASDTVRIHVYIMDRAGNTSNVIEIGPLNFPAYVQ